MTHGHDHGRRGTPARPEASVARRWRTIWVAAVAALAGAATAAGFLALDLGQRLAATQNAAVGVVAAIDVEVRDGEPWTLVTLDVELWWRQDGVAVPGGDDGAGDATLTAAFWGGRAPGVDPLQVAGVPAFVLGERVIWWLRGADDGLAAPTVGVTQGVWRDDEGVWRGDDGTVLGLDERGDLGLDGESVPDAVLFDAIDAAFATTGGAP